MKMIKDDIDLKKLSDHFILNFYIKFKYQNFTFLKIDIFKNVIKDIEFNPVFFDTYNFGNIVEYIDNVFNMDISLKNKINKVIDIVIFNFEFFNFDFVENVTYNIFNDMFNENDINNIINYDTFLFLDIIDSINKVIITNLVNCFSIDEYNSLGNT